MNVDEIIKEGVEFAQKRKTSKDYRECYAKWKMQCLSYLDEIKANRIIVSNFQVAFGNFEFHHYEDRARIDDIIGYLKGLSQEETPRTKKKQIKNNENNNKSVFIVHGHNKALRTEVKTVLLELGLKPIILSEQANGGKTVIEKFEENSEQVNYAIILMTADDEGKAVKDTDYRLRARQNVILEMGYFMSRLKRSNVFLLLEDDIELPSDINGVVYASVRENWKFMLVKELKNCGYQVSADDLS